MRTKKLITTMRKSQLTGQVVWVYRAATKSAINVAYWRAKKAERERIDRWTEYINRRRTAIKQFLNNLLSNLPLMAELTDAQHQAVKTIQHIAQTQPLQDLTFYEHIQDEQARRIEDRKLRRREKQ